MSADHVDEHSVRSATRSVEGPVSLRSPVIMPRMFHGITIRSRPFSVWAPIVVAVWLLTACGGGSGHRTPASNGPAGTAAANVTNSVVVDPPAQDVPPLVALGAPTGLAAGAGATSDISASVDETLCTVDDPLVSCMGATGAGGQFVVTVENDANDFTIRTVGVRCGLSPAVTMANATGKQLIVLGQLNFAEFGGVIGVARYGAGDEAFLVVQPTGSTCPQVFGLGPIKLNSIMSGGTDVVGITRPDGSLACVVADGAGSFLVSEQQTGC